MVWSLAMKIKLMIASALTLLMGCKTMPATEPVKALLVDMNDQTKLQITKIVSDSMKGKSVAIADTVFLKDNRMSITGIEYSLENVKCKAM